MQALIDFKAFIIMEAIKVRAVTLPLFKKEEVVNFIFMHLRHWMHLLLQMGPYFSFTVTYPESSFITSFQFINQTFQLPLTISSFILKSFCPCF